MKRECKYILEDYQDMGMSVVFMSTNAAGGSMLEGHRLGMVNHRSWYCKAGEARSMPITSCLHAHLGLAMRIEIILMAEVSVLRFIASPMSCAVDPGYLYVPPFGKDNKCVLPRHFGWSDTFFVTKTDVSNTLVYTHLWFSVANVCRMA